MTLPLRIIKRSVPKPILRRSNRHGLLLGLNKNVLTDLKAVARRSYMQHCPVIQVPAKDVLLLCV